MIRCRKCGRETDFLVDGNEAYCEECVYGLEEEINNRAFKNAETMKANSNAISKTYGSITLPNL